MRFQILTVFMMGAVLQIVGAQTPDVKVIVDLRPTVKGETSQEPGFRWYDQKGRPSVVGFTLTLEPGYRIYATQRLQKIKNNPDQDQLDEYYIEDPGRWRLGKQTLPFGQVNILRENIWGARYNTQLVFDELPIQIIACDGGTGLGRGVAGRIGTRFGVSFALGNHFGIQSTALSQVRDPEDTPGKSRGWRLAIGADYSHAIGPVRFNAEWITFRKGETVLDENEDISDLRAVMRIPRIKSNVTAAWSRSWRDHKDFYRIEGEIFLNRNLTLSPFIRFTGHKMRDVGISTRIRL